MTTGYRRRWLPGVVSAAAAAVVLAGCSSAAPGSTQESGPAPTVSTPAVPRNDQTWPISGVFRSTDAAATHEFETWLGRPKGIVVDFPAEDTWQQIARPDYLLQEWQNQPYRLAFSLFILPDQEGGSMADGAKGRYNDYYRQLAETMVAHGHADAIVRVGWEFNIPGWKWYTTNAADYQAYFRQIVETMRSVPGSRLQFCWNPGAGERPVDGADYYPGDDVVDIVGVDLYDVSYVDNGYPYPDNCDDACRTQHQQTVWDNDLYGGTRGLRYWSEFAQSHGRPLAIPEWGLWQRVDNHGGGDNPTFIQNMASFIRDPGNNVMFEAYFEWRTDDESHSLVDSFPNSAQTYRLLWK
ncbi:MAG: glycosyl hydrolase [Dermatophilaceae bacterium]